jgi:hypothetical protein
MEQFQDALKGFEKALTLDPSEGGPEVSIRETVDYAMRVYDGIAKKVRKV